MCKVVCLVLQPAWASNVFVSEYVMSVRILTIVPAKLGSTRLPKKNILPLGGKSLLQWCVDAALESGVSGTIMVSTESHEVAEIAKQVGAEIPFMRPNQLGREPYGVEDVCRHVLEEYLKQGRSFDVVQVLLPTSPFRTGEDICNAMEIFQEPDVLFATSVSSYQNDIFSAHSMTDEGVLEPMFPGLFEARPEARPVPYEINGAITIADVQAFVEQGTLYGSPLRAYVMPADRSVDIDTKDDFEYAEYLLRNRSKKCPK